MLGKEQQSDKGQGLLFYAREMASEEQTEKTSLPPEEEEVDVKPPSPTTTEGSIGKKEVEIPDCPVHSVVVYPDRAEVCSVACKKATFSFIK